MTRRLTAAALALTVLGMAGVSRAGTTPTPQAPTGVAARAESYEARRWLWMGSIAARFEDYDLATQVYQRVVSRFPNTSWASTAQESLAQLKTGAGISFALWDPAAGGTPAGVQAAELLHAGEVAAAMRDWLIALQFYERAKIVAPHSQYARVAESRIRWIQNWHRPGP